MTGPPWSPKDKSKDGDKDTFVFPAGPLLRTVTGQDDGLKADKAEEDQELKEPPQDGQAVPISPEEAAELEEPQTPRTRPREGEEPLDLFSRLSVRRRITRTNFGGSPKRGSFRK